MNLDDYRTVFVAIILILILIAASPTFGLILKFPSKSESFSELWILGPNHIANDYPFNVHLNESYSVFVGVGNHLGVSSYYLVYVKLRNQTQPLPNATVSEPSPLQPLYEFRAFVTDGGAWEALVKFNFSSLQLLGDSVFLNRIVIYDEVFTVNSFSKRDLEHNGFYYQLFFELWWYNVTSATFQFNNRFVGIWLNVTG